MSHKNCKRFIVHAKLLALYTFITTSFGIKGSFIFVTGIGFTIITKGFIIERLPPIKERSRGQKCFNKAYMYVINYVVFQATMRQALNTFSLMYFQNSLAGSLFLFMTKEYMADDVMLYAYKFYNDKITITCANTQKTEAALLSKGIFHFLTSLYSKHKYGPILDIVRTGFFNEIIFAWKSNRIKSGVEIKDQKETKLIVVATVNECIHRISLIKSIAPTIISLIDTNLINIPEYLNKHCVAILSGVVYIVTKHLIKSLYLDRA